MTRYLVLLVVLVGCATATGNRADRTVLPPTSPGTPAPPAASSRPRASVSAEAPLPAAVVASPDSAADRPHITVHSHRHVTFAGHVAPAEVCGPWREAQHGAFEDLPCDVSLVDGDLSIVEAPHAWGQDLLLVRRTAAGETEVVRIAVPVLGVDYNEAIVFRGLERREVGERVLIRLELSGEGQSCDEPRSYTVQARLLVVCDADVCTRPIPVYHREEATLLDADWEEVVEQVTTEFRLRVRLTPNGVQVTRQGGRGEIPPRFGGLLGRHTLEALEPAR